MSKWTHVIGAIRYDGISIKKNDALFEKLYGKIRHEDIGYGVTIHRSDEVPSGSEGCLTYTVVYSPDNNSISYADVLIEGDLRDYEVSDWGEIEEWFHKITHPPKETAIWVRQGVLLMEDDGFNAPVNRVLRYVREEE